MKRIIAAALSVLVGAFGYTIVDKALENRVATLESEVVELREEVSRDSHENNLNNVINTSNVEQKKLEVGQFINESSNSRHKFLIRKYSNGRIEYRSPKSLGMPHLTTARHFYDAAPVPYSESYSDNLQYNDCYLYISESFAQITKIITHETVCYSWLDDNYSKQTTNVGQYKTEILFSGKGFTDSSLAGRKIFLDINFDHYYHQIEGIEFVVNEDGSFDYSTLVTIDVGVFDTATYYFDRLVVK
ncbi:MAG: hypothetical protein IJF57_00045 [Clostridia bacterium]|nr:hypothetical protein [Clostridia bacterium]